MKRLQVMNTMYWRRINATHNRQQQLFPVGHDALIMVIKNHDTKEKRLEIIEKPNIRYYMSREKNESVQSIYKDKSELDEIQCRYLYRMTDMARKVNKNEELKRVKDQYYDWKKRNTEGNYLIESELRKNIRSVEHTITSHPDLYLTDINIEDFYKTELIQKHGSHHGDIHKAFFDIETRNTNFVGFADENTAPCPISLITLCDNQKPTLYAFCLRDKTNPQIRDVEADIPKFIDWMTSEDDFERFSHYSFSINFYNDELELITQFFHTLHAMSPDFIGAWNAKFDILTIINRLRYTHGKHPEDYFCEAEIPFSVRKLRFKEDRNNVKHPSRLWHWLQCTSKTQFYDMMALYSIIRKRTLYPSYSLNAIALEELGEKKVNLSQFGYETTTVEQQNYRWFLKYGLKDTGLLKCIEDKTHDLDRVLIMADNTRLECFDRVSFTIKNNIYQTLQNDQKIIGSNVDYGTVESVPGALVASPQNLIHKGILIHGLPSYVFENVIDLDATAQYPTIMMVFNVIKNLIYGLVYEIQDNGTGQVLMRERGEFNKKLQTLDSSILDIGEKYFGLPSIATILKHVEDIVELEKKYYEKTKENV